MILNHLFHETYTFHNKRDQIIFYKYATGTGIEFEVVLYNANGRIPAYKGRNELLARQVVAYEYNKISPVARMEVFK